MYVYIYIYMSYTYIYIYIKRSASSGGGGALDPQQLAAPIAEQGPSVGIPNNNNNSTPLGVVLFAAMCLNLFGVYLPKTTIMMLF